MIHTHRTLVGTFPPQHLRKRGQRTAFARLLRRIQMGTTTDADMWRVLSLRSRLIRAEAERDALREGVEELRACHDQHYADMLALGAENERLRGELSAWEAWEHAWVFGGEVPWPGHSGVTDPRETLDEMIRVAFGYPCDSVAEMQQEIGRLRAYLGAYEDFVWGEGPLPAPPDMRD